MTGTLEPYLRTHPGYSFCVHCLARDLRTPVGLLRKAMWTLEVSEAFRVRTAQCVSCLLTKRVISHETPSGDEEIPRRVIDFLTKSIGQAFCPRCVAFATDVALADVKRLLLDLEPVAEFARHKAPCSACGRWLRLIGSGRQEDIGSSRVEERIDLVSGRILYRGLRIDLLSFRSSEGWRPFALVRRGNGASVPNAPVVVLGLEPTKMAADRVAASRAREWIDLRYT